MLGVTISAGALKRLRGPKTLGFPRFFAGGVEPHWVGVVPYTAPGDALALERCAPMLEKTTTLEILLARHPGAVLLAFEAAGLALSMKLQTARNQLVAGVFPVPTHKVGGRRVVRIDDLAAYIDSQTCPAIAGARRGASTKTERLQALAAGITVKELRAQGGAA